MEQVTHMSYVPMPRAKKTLALRLFLQFLVLLILNAVLWDVDATWLVLPVNMPYSPYASGVGAIYLLQRMLTAAIIPFLAVAVFVIIVICLYTIYILAHGVIIGNQG